MTPAELQMLKKQAMEAITNHAQATPETVADCLDVSLPVAEQIVRMLIAEGKLHMHKK